MANSGYLFQTLLSATQARQVVAPAATDIILFDLTADPGRESRIISDVCAAEGVRYEWADPAILDGLHVANGRLFLSELLPDRYDQLLYLDGDTQIVGDLAPLLNFHPQPGALAGVRDPMVYREHLNIPGPDWQNGKADAGNRYINSGVIRVGRKDWRMISEKALSIIRSGRRFPFLDQDAINEAADGAIDHLSVAWNFPGFMLGSGLDALTQPRIVHFMSNPRPWQGAFLPWGRQWHRPYMDLVLKHPELAPYRATLPHHRMLGYKVKETRKFVLERTWRSAEMIASAMHFEQMVAA